MDDTNRDGLWCDDTSTSTGWFLDQADANVSTGEGARRLEPRAAAKLADQAAETIG